MFNYNGTLLDVRLNLQNDKTVNCQQLVRIRAR